MKKCGSGHPGSKHDSKHHEKMEKKRKGRAK